MDGAPRDGSRLPQAHPRSVGTVVGTVELTLITAHASFFVEGAPAPSVGALLAPGPLLAVAIGVTAALAAWAVAATCADPRRPRCAVRMLSDMVSAPLSNLTCLVPVIARVALGTAMLWCAAIGSIATPNLGVHATGLDGLRAAAALTGLLLLLDVRTRLAAGAAVATFITAAAAAGQPIVALERLDVIGLAAFVVIVGGTRLDHRIEPAMLARIGRGATWLRCCLAAGLLTVAITEKLANVPMTALVLEQHPRVDPGPLLGIEPVTTVLLLGAVEVAFAVLVFLLPLPELVALAIGAPFVATVGEFGMLEVPGHLPVWGGVAVLALLGAHLQTADLVTVRPPWMRHRARTPEAARERIVGDRVPWVEPLSEPATVGVPIRTVLVGSSTGPVADSSPRPPQYVALPSPPPIVEPVAAWLASGPGARPAGDTADGLPRFTWVQRPAPAQPRVTHGS